MNWSRRRRTGPGERAVRVISLVGLGAQTVAYDFVVDRVNSWLGNAVLVVLIVALVATLITATVRWRARRNPPAPQPPDPDEPQPEAGKARDLPHVAQFVGRRGALDYIMANCERTVAVVGRRGVGTSACVKQAAALLRSRDAEAPDGHDDAMPWFPDDVVYLNLRSGKRNLPAEEMLVALAEWFAVPAPASADDAAVDRSAQRLRNHLADEGRKVLLVLDDVDDPAQVRPLLPLPPQCRVLLAGCPQLSRLDDVVECWLDEPTPAEASQLFMLNAHAPGDKDWRLNPRTDPALRQLIELCGRMPRPLRALAYDMARHRWQPAEVLEALRRMVVAPTHQELAYLQVLDVLADQDVAYAALPVPARKLYRRLALAPGPLEPEAVAMLWRPRVLGARPWPGVVRRWARKRTASRVSELLNELANAGSVESGKGHRYRLRQPLLTYAELHLRRDDLRVSRVGAEIRLARHLARKAQGLAARLSTTNDVYHPTSYGEHVDPYTWFKLHHRSLRRLVSKAAGAPGIPPEVQPRRLRRWWFRIAMAVSAWYAAANWTRDWEWTCEKVLTTPTAGDRWRIASWAANELGVIQRRRGDTSDAYVTLTRALKERERRHWGEAPVLTNIGLTFLDRGDETSVGLATWSLQVAERHRSPGDRAGLARTDVDLGVAYLAGGELAKAQDHLRRAAHSFDQLEDRRSAAVARTNLGLVQWQLDERLEARETLELAVADHDALLASTRVELTDPRGRTAALLNLGAALVSTQQSLSGAPRRHGRPEDSLAARAEALLQEGLALRPDRPRTAGLGRTHLYLGDAIKLLGRDDDEVVQHWKQAAAICFQSGDTAGEDAAQRRLRRGT